MQSDESTCRDILYFLLISSLLLTFHRRSSNNDSFRKHFTATLVLFWVSFLNTYIQIMFVLLYLRWGWLIHCQCTVASLKKQTGVVNV